MNTERTTKKDLYYTNDHEWVDFQGTVAYMGVCSFKLLGFKEIHQIIFNEIAGFKKQGEVIATIKYNDYQIEAHMAIDGKLMQVNDSLLNHNQNILILDPENAGWIGLITPSQPYERKDLLLPKQYQMNRKCKYAK